MLGNSQYIRIAQQRDVANFFDALILLSRIVAAQMCDATKA